jgi:hypothetical protein
MKTYKTMQAARYGLYTSSNPIDVRFVGAEGEALDGLPGASYRRVPTPLALVAAPLLGGAFVMAFPVLVLVAAFVVVARFAATAVAQTLQEQAFLASPRWQPVMSYLTKGHKKAGQAEVAAELKDLHSEVAKVRAEESNKSE